MRQVSLREFRRRGSKALSVVPPGETVLLSGRKGPAYFLVPVIGDVAMQDRELSEAVAKSSLRLNWSLAEAVGQRRMNEDDIDREIDHVRSSRMRRKVGSN